MESEPQRRGATGLRVLVSKEEIQPLLSHHMFQSHSWDECQGCEHEVMAVHVYMFNTAVI